MRKLCFGFIWFLVLYHGIGFVIGFSSTQGQSFQPVPDHTVTAPQPDVIEVEDRLFMLATAFFVVLGSATGVLPGTART